MKRILMTWVMSLTMASTFAQVFEAPEVMAEYPGGVNAMMTFLTQTLKYPAGCEKDRVEGRVLLTFIVNEDGTITDMEVMQSPDDRLTAEAKRVVSLMPVWKPAKNKGKVVKMKYTLPLMFRLPDGAKQGFDKQACDSIARLIAGKKENPHGLYKLLRFSYENGAADKGPHIDQYKYCTDSLTLQLQVQKDVWNTTAQQQPEFWMSILNQDRRPLTYTGNVADEDISIFDSDNRGFKLRWHNTIMNNEFMPMGQYITELYASGYKINANVRRVTDLLAMKLQQREGNRFFGCWRRVGVLTKVDGRDLLMPGHQDLYQIFDRDVYLHFYELMADRMYAYCIMRPITYKSDNVLVQYGSESQIEWIDDNTFHLRFDRGDGTIVTELWKRSGLPKTYQTAFGTNVPIYEVPTNPLPNYFGR